MGFDAVSANKIICVSMTASLICDVKDCVTNGGCASEQNFVDLCVKSTSFFSIFIQKKSQESLINLQSHH